MNCTVAQPLLGALVDGELALREGLEIEEHLRACPGCAAERNRLIALQQTLRRAPLRFSAPAGLEAQIRTKLPVVEKPAALAPRKTMPFRLPLPWLAAAAGLVAALFFSVAVFRRPSAEAGLAREAVDNHVRSLLANHLVDIATSDRHTVKPWFNGRLDFSPPVVDLAGDGYPLAGGRLDFLGGRVVAALVYHRDRHTINVFLWPDAGMRQSAAPRASERQGFHVIPDSAAGMSFLVVSDLNAEDLVRFTTMFRARVGSATGP